MECDHHDNKDSSHEEEVEKHGMTEIIGRDVCGRVSFGGRGTMEGRRRVGV